jgi:hypothetical protein
MSRHSAGERRWVYLRELADLSHALPDALHGLLRWPGEACWRGLRDAHPDP